LVLRPQVGVVLFNVVDAGPGDDLIGVVAEVTIAFLSVWVFFHDVEFEAFVHVSILDQAVIGIEVEAAFVADFII